MNFNNFIKEELNVAKNILEKFLESEENINKIDIASDIIVNSFKNKGKTISCGNGSSMCNSMLFSELLTGKYKEEKEPYPALSISDSTHISNIGNYHGYNMIFSRFIHAHGNDNDVLFAISSGGESENILKAIEKAKLKNLKIIALTGKKGLTSDTADYVDVEICIPHENYSDRIVEMHSKIIHILVGLIEIKMDEK